MGTRGRLPPRYAEGAIVAALHALGCVLVLALGFDHISDDDFARVTIAQSFAHAPKLDPSATSWLPFPFWALGSIMAVAGRSLAAARVASIALSSAAAVLPYLALRTTGASRRAAMLALAFAMLSPWSLWLGAATVPESFTASCTAAAAIALGSRRAPGPAFAARVGFALALLAACLSRYEPWPVAAVLALVLAVRALRPPADTSSPLRAPATRARDALVLAAIVAAGPLLWMAWNAYAHGDPTHFFQRVARFKRALGEATPGTLEALLLYPRLFVTRRPDIVVALALAFGGLRGMLRTSREEIRAAWLVPLGCAAAEVAFLAYGNARDGAPAHHAERALLGVVFLSAMFAADVLVLAGPAALAQPLAAQPRSAQPRSPLRALTCAALVALAWLGTGVVTFRDIPGSRPADARTAQIFVGSTLRAENVEHIVLTPCAYEHFAVVAAFAAPEKVTTLPRTDAPVTGACPAIERR